MSHRSWSSLLGCALVISLLVPDASAGTMSASSRSEAKQIKRRVQATQFLSLATFGARPDEVEALAQRMKEIGVRRAKAEWIDRQLRVSPTLHLPKTEAMFADDGFDATQRGINANRYKYHAWWDTAIAADDQLRQRMAWALAQIFAIDANTNGFGNLRIDASGKPQNLGVVSFYDMLVNNALGNYRETLMDVTLHPVMGRWLSHVRNRSDRDPDENFGREIQQLFTIGLYKLRLNGRYITDINGAQIPTYSNEEVKAFARVFTGLHYAGDETRFYSPLNYHDPMIMFERLHDAEEKVLHNGTVLPAGQDGMTDVNAAVDNLFAHRNVAPFVSRLLIQRLVKSNPSRGYIRRVATVFNDNGYGVKGDLAAVAKAILLDREARGVRCRIQRRPWRVTIRTRGTAHSRLQEPIVRYINMIRALDGSSDHPQGWYMLPDLQYHLHQMPYRHHHVFNFYDVEHIPHELLGYNAPRWIPNGVLFAPEFQILTAVSANRFRNRLRAALIDGTESFTLLNNSNGLKQIRITFDLSHETELANEPSDLVEHLDLLLAGGTMHDESRKILSAALSEETTNLTVRARAAALSVLLAPEAAIAP